MSIWLAAAGRVYIASDRGTVTVIKAGEEFQILARTDLNERTMASPALAGEALYIRSAKRLRAFGATQP